jgi:vacuolar-type H+-ATPase subunit F/Vma7
LVPGFQLAGVDAYGAVDVETAEELITAWLDTQETGLLAIDEGLLERLDPGLIRRMDSYEPMPYLPIPGGGALGPEVSRKLRIAQSIRRAIGFHITFKGEEIESGE